MPKITVEGIEYNTEDFRKWKSTARFTAVFGSSDEQIENEIAVYQTARATYIATLKNELEGQ